MPKVIFKDEAVQVKTIRQGDVLSVKGIVYIVAKLGMEKDTMQLIELESGNRYTDRGTFSEYQTGQELMEIGYFSESDLDSLIIYPSSIVTLKVEIAK